MIRTTTYALLLAFASSTAVPVLASAASFNPASAGVELSVSMGADGSARVSGARVRQVTDAGVVAETLWGSGKITWTIQTDETTPIYRKSGAKIALTDVTPGDYVSFTGKIEQNKPPFTVDADSMRDWSIGENRTVLSGTIEAIDKETRTFTLVTGKGGRMTVSVDEDTAYAQSGAQVFADLSVGDMVLAFGDKAGGASMTAQKVNLTERAVARKTDRPVLATGLGSWVDSMIPMFFAGRGFNS